jgi:predicted acylesterase/phospholipase RssA
MVREAKTVNDQKYILAIDGGGVRGMIALYALQELEAQQGPAKELFSFTAGTSTGAIIISALALGVPAERLITSYRNLMGKIFHDGLYVQGMETLSAVYARLGDSPLPFHDLFAGLSSYSDAAARFPRGYLYPSENIAKYFSEAIEEETGLDPHSAAAEPGEATAQGQMPALCSVQAPR